MRCTFAIEFTFYGRDNPAANFQQLENNLNEQLDGQIDEFGKFRLYRHKADFAKTQLEEWANKCVEKRFKSNCIDIDRCLSTG